MGELLRMKKVTSRYDGRFKRAKTSLQLHASAIRQKVKELLGAYLTFRFRLLVIGLADELPIFHEVKLIACVQLPGAKGARETRQMVNQFLRPSYHLRRRQTLAAARAFRPETPATPTTYNIFTLHSHINDKRLFRRRIFIAFREIADNPIADRCGAIDKYALLAMFRVA